MQLPIAVSPAPLSSSVLAEATFALGPKLEALGAGHGDRITHGHLAVYG